MKRLLSLSALVLVVTGCASPDDVAGSGDASGSPEQTATPTPVDDGPASEVSTEDDTGDAVVEASGDVAEEPLNVDVVHTDLRRTADTLTITVSYDDIEENGSSEWMVDFQLVNPNGARRQVNWSEADQGDGTFRQTVTMHRLAQDSVLGNPCPGLEGAADYDAETVTVTVPNRCFGDPAWVKVRDLKATARAADGSAWYVDGPLGAGESGSTDSAPLEKVTS
jgi:hypothetical protein